MPKRTRKKRRNFFKWLPITLKVLGVVAVLCGLVWVAMLTEDGDDAPVWDGKKSAILGVAYDEKYDEVVALAASGGMVEARGYMAQMAPLSEGDIQPRGYGKAHLWMAKDLLGRFQSDFLLSFPFGVTDAGHSTVPYRLPSDSHTLLAQRHLEHAIFLDPSDREAPTMLAAVWLARGQRGQAIQVMMAAIVNRDHLQPELQVPLMNVLTFEGDDIEMEEHAWHALTLLGKSVEGSSRDNLSERVEYSLQSILLKKYENAASVIRKMERDFTNAKKFPDAEASIQALKAAMAYRKAVVLAGKVSKPYPSGDGNEYQPVVNALGLALAAQPTHSTIIDALSALAQHYPRLRAQIKSELEKSTRLSPSSGEGSSVRTHLLLSALSDGDTNDARKHLESAVKVAPDDVDALIGLAELLYKDDQPDYQRIYQLSTHAIQVAEKTNHDGVADGRYYFLQGVSSVELKKWEAAIVSLERALSLCDRKAARDNSRTIHQYLARGYRGVGQLKMAAKHESAAKAL